MKGFHFIACGISSPEELKTRFLHVIISKPWFAMEVILPRYRWALSLWAKDLDSLLAILWFCGCGGNIFPMAPFWNYYSYANPRPSIMIRRFTHLLQRMTFSIKSVKICMNPCIIKHRHHLPQCPLQSPFTVIFLISRNQSHSISIKSLVEKTAPLRFQFSDSLRNDFGRGGGKSPLAYSITCADFNHWSPLWLVVTSIGFLNDEMLSAFAAAKPAPNSRTCGSKLQTQL